MLRYLHATGDDEFARGAGLELLVATARLWRSLGHHDARGAFHIDGVTGPDEYSAVADDNVYTNLMAARNLAGAAESCARHRDEAAALGVERRGDRRVARRGRARSPCPTTTSSGSTSSRRATRATSAGTSRRPTPDEYPLLLHFPYFDLYRKQVVKQADLVLAMVAAGDRFTARRRRRAPSPTTSR